MTALGVPIMPRLAARRWSSTWYREFLLGAWLNSFLAAMILVGIHQPGLLFVALVAGLPLTLCLLPAQPIRFMLSPFTVLGSLLLLAAILLSYGLNLGRYDLPSIAGNVLSTFVAFAIAYLLATRLSLNYSRLLACHSAIAMLLLPIPLATGSFLWGRFFLDLQPNFIGMIAMLAFIGGLCIANWIGKLLVTVMSVGIMLLVSSRTSLLSAAVAMLVYGACAAFMPATAAKRESRTRRMALVTLAGLLALYFLESTGIPVVDTILNTVFKLNDPYRGVASGASGRLELWEAALALWQTQPIFGVGFRGTVSLIGNYAHSAYLTVLAETGIVGLCGYLLLCAGALVGTFRARRDARSIGAFALICSFLLYGFWESRGFGFGNPYSLLFLWIAFDSNKRNAVDRHETHGPRGLAANADPIPAGRRYRPLEGLVRKKLDKR